MLRLLRFPAWHGRCARPAHRRLRDRDGNQHPGTQGGAAHSGGCELRNGEASRVQSTSRSEGWSTYFVHDRPDEPGRQRQDQVLLKWLPSQKRHAVARNCSCAARWRAFTRQERVPARLLAKQAPSPTQPPWLRTIATGRLVAAAARGPNRDRSLFVRPKTLALVTGAAPGIGEGLS